MKILKRVFVTTDFSELSMATFEYATPIFKLNGAQIYLLHVLDENALGRKSKSEKCLNQNSRDATNYA